MPIVIGVDAGGTKTRAIVVDAEDSELSVLGAATSGPGNIRATGIEALREIETACDHALAAANVSAGSVAAFGMGVAGAGRDSEKSQLREWASQRAPVVVVTHDADAALAAGIPAGAGVALISGTGSLAFGRNVQGRQMRAGGWGYLLGDEGSGYAIAKDALGAVVRAADGRGPATALTAVVLKRLGVADLAAMVETVYSPSAAREAIAALAPTVLQTARSGDAVARSIIEKAAEDLAELVAAVARPLGFRRPLPLALTGGVLIGSSSLRQRLIERLNFHGLTPEPVEIVADSALGAARLAQAAWQANR